MIPATLRVDDTLPDDDDIIFLVDETSDLPIWVQLRNRIAYLIRKGRFQPGEQLPSVRSLAADAKINYNTVTKAYRDLELSNLIVSVRGRGMYVQKDATFDDSPEKTVDTLLETCIRQYQAAGLTCQDIRVRILKIVVEIENEARLKAEEKADYYGEAQ